MKNKTIRMICISIVIFMLLLMCIYIITAREKKVLNELIRKEQGGTYIQLSHGITHYNLQGPQDGNVLVLVHGGTLPIFTWDPQVPTFIAAGFRVLTYDMYGRGFSDRPDVTYNRDLYCRQLLELIEKLELAVPVVLMGSSFGGATVVNFTVKHPELIRKIALISPIINKSSRSPAIFLPPVIGEFTMRVLGVPFFIKRSSALYKGDKKEEYYTELFVTQTQFKGFERSLLSMIRSDAIGDYREVYKTLGRQDIDVLVLWGSADEEVTNEMMEELKDLVPQVQFHTLENIGHGIKVHLQTDKVNPILLDFLNYKASDAQNVDGGE